MNCDLCRKDCSADFVTADCTYHYLCGTCTAVFLDGLSPAPVCHKCFAREVYERFTKTHEDCPKLKKKMTQQLKLSPTRLTPFQDKMPYQKSPSVDSSDYLTATDAHVLGSYPDLSVETERNRPEAHINQAFSKNIPVISERGNVIFKIDMHTGKMVRFFPYTPIKVKDTQERIKQKFDKVSPQSKEDMSNYVAFATNIPSNNSSYSAEADMKYIDNLFSFLREEKSKRQSFAVPSIKSRYHPDELEFNIKKGECSSSNFLSESTQLSFKKSPKTKAPVLNTLLNQIEPDTDEDKVTEVEEGNTLQYKYQTSTTSERQQVNHDMPLLLGRSVSPASDVKGEYGSEDDKLSISSESGSAWLQNEESERVDSSSGHGESPRMDTDGALQCPDEEVERCSSPCKGVRRNQHRVSLPWNQDECLDKVVSTLPEPPARSGARTASSEEEDSAEIQGICQKSSSSSTDILSNHSKQYLQCEPSTTSNPGAFQNHHQTYGSGSLTNVFEDDGFWDQ